MVSPFEIRLLPASLSSSTFCGSSAFVLQGVVSRVQPLSPTRGAVCPASDLVSESWRVPVLRSRPQVGLRAEPSCPGSGLSSHVAGSVLGFERGRRGAKPLHTSTSFYAFQHSGPNRCCPPSAAARSVVQLSKQDRPSNPSRSSGRLAQFQVTAAFGRFRFGEQRWPAWAARLAPKRYAAQQPGRRES